MKAGHFRSLVIPTGLMFVGWGSEGDSLAFFEATEPVVTELEGSIRMHSSHQLLGTHDEPPSLDLEALLSQLNKFFVQLVLHVRVESMTSRSHFSGPPLAFTDVLLLFYPVLQSFGVQSKFFTSSVLSVPFMVEVKNLDLLLPGV